MKRETPVTVLTDDGSPTLYLPALDEHYHSVRGAVAESMHVYIKTGLEACGRETVDLFECGFAPFPDRVFGHEAGNERVNHNGNHRRDAGNKNGGIHCFLRVFNS